MKRKVSGFLIDALAALMLIAFILAVGIVLGAGLHIGWALLGG